MRNRPAGPLLTLLLTSQPLCTVTSASQLGGWEVHEKVLPGFFALDRHLAWLQDLFEDLFSKYISTPWIPSNSMCHPILTPLCAIPRYKVTRYGTARAGSAALPFGLQETQRLLHTTRMRLATMLWPPPARHKDAKAYNAALPRALRGTGVLRSTPPHTCAAHTPQPCAVTVRTSPLTPLQGSRAVLANRASRGLAQTLGQGSSRAGGTSRT